MRRHKKSWPALIVPSQVLILPLPVNKFPNKPALKVPNNIPRNPPVCFFASFLTVSLTPFINKPDSSRDLTVFPKLLMSYYQMETFFYE